MRIVVHDYAGHAFPPSLSRELAARGHEVVHAFASSLQTPRGELRTREGDPSSLSFREVAMDSDYVRYKYSFLRRRKMEIAYGKEAARFISEWRPDAVISGNTPTEAQGPIVRAAVGCGARFHYWVQDFYSLAVDKLVRKKLPLVGIPIGAWYRHLDRRQFRDSSTVIAITEDFAPVLSQEFGVDPSRVAVIPNWALIDEIPSLPKDNDWSRKHGLHDKFVFLYTGTIGMKHNPGLLLELARHYAADPEVRVVVVSEGIGSEWLREQSAKENLTNLVLLPYQPFGDLPAVMASGDVLTAILEPEAAEFSVPSKTLTYLCAERPLLLAMPAGNLAARITGRNDAGVIVPPHDTGAFVREAAYLRDSPERRGELARNARAYAERTFPIGRTAQAFEDLLTSA
ncbi:glycosyltransferase family 4 protein [Luteolibacter sp. SL250]|uniref:glycosyltransferase family 4 protein n=1 Tax=Luteolibacter sp. SL250 TaxID=2995170 RepID=UPI002271CA76|nr:glycosyltransferase family 4 protein [Luteolibacter sp. SL250]WAC21497.1 glycosyltransferase family 4 protein [Luteolibacter sp. SL250]